MLIINVNIYVVIDVSNLKTKKTKYSRKLSIR